MRWDVQVQYLCCGQSLTSCFGNNEKTQVALASWCFWASHWCIVFLFPTDYGWQGEVLIQASGGGDLRHILSPSIANLCIRASGPSEAHQYIVSLLLWFLASNSFMKGRRCLAKQGGGIPRSWLHYHVILLKSQINVNSRPSQWLF